MMNWRSWLLSLLLLIAASTALAATPTEVSISYNLFRNGTQIGVIDERLEIKDGAYRATSNSTAIGIFALAQRRALQYASNGEVTKEGLRPHHFEVRRGNELATADFDWKAEKLTMNVNGQAETVDLPPATQDRLSIMYQLMYIGPNKPRTLEFAMATGRKLDRYRYVITPDVVIDTPLKRLSTLHLVKQREQDDTGTEIWLAPEFHYLPVRVVIVESDGVRYEQVATHVEAK